MNIYNLDGTVNNNLGFDDDNILSFDSISDFKSTLNSMPWIDRNKYNSSQEIYSDSTNWSGTKNMVEANLLLERGVEEIYQKLTSGLNDFDCEKQIILKKQRRSKIVGSNVSVPRFLNNDPRCMNHYEKNKIKDEYINIYICMSYSANVSSSEILKYGIKSLNMINNLPSNIKYNLYSLGISEMGTSLHVTRIKIKNHNDLTSLNDISYFFHPSFLRRHMFELKEKHPTKKCTGGYGRANFDKVTKLKMINKNDLLFYRGNAYDGDLKEIDIKRRKK